MEAVWEPKGHKGTETGYFSVDDGLVWKYEAMPIENGWHGSPEYIFAKDKDGAVLFRNALGTRDKKCYEADRVKMKNG